MDKNLFNTKNAAIRPVARDEKGQFTKNEAGGIAYKFTEEHALAQAACTGTFRDSYYVKADKQLDQLIAVSGKVSTEFLAQCAVYSRRKGYMKDMPAVLMGVLCARAASKVPEEAKLARDLFEVAFPLTIDNPKMLRNFVQVMRSGVTGRKAFGSMPKRLMREWFDARSPNALFRGSVGNDPTLADCIRLARPNSNLGTVFDAEYIAERSKTEPGFAENAAGITAIHEGRVAERAELYKYLLGFKTPNKATEIDKERGYVYDVEKLPELVQHFEAFKKAIEADASTKMPVPQVPFQMLTALPLNTSHWTQLATQGGWMFTRMNVNTFARHGVFKDAKVTKQIANRLSNAEAIKKAKAFPYQLLTAFKNVDTDTPRVITNALQDAMEVAVENVPALPGKVFVFPDVSGSMGQAVTGYSSTHTSATTCVDVAALVSAALLRTCDDATVVPVDTRLHFPKLNPRDSVMSLASTLSGMGGGGTRLALGLEHINTKTLHVDTIVMVSDIESWADRGYAWHGNTATTMEAEWQRIKQRCPNAKLVCIDIVPHGTTQAGDKKNSVLNLGGFSDNVWTVIERFVAGDDADTWVEAIKAEPLESTEKI